MHDSYPQDIHINKHLDAVMNRMEERVADKALRVSVTDVENFRWFKMLDTKSMDSFIADLRREGEETEAMRLGTAMHTILEEQTGTLEKFEQNGFPFDFKLDAEISVPEIKEIKGTKLYGGINLVGKVDALSGLIIYDHKLTAKFADDDKYCDSFQWRAYLDMFDCDVFQYNIFVQSFYKRSQDYKVKELHQLRFYRYPGLAEEVARDVEEFHNFYKAHVA